MILELPLIKLRFTFRLQHDLLLPPYAGSALRGVFGSSLKRVVCLSGKENCEACKLQLSCPYAVVFNSSASNGENGANPYIIEPPMLKERLLKSGDTLVFHQILIGDAVSKLSYVLLAWIKGFQYGMGKNRARASLVSVYQELEDKEIYLYGENEEQIKELQPIYVLSVPDDKREITLKIETPLRIQREKHPIVPEALTTGDFFSSLIRRTELLYKNHIHTASFLNDKTNLLIKAKALNEEKRELYWKDWIRWSARQQTHIALGGVAGEWTLSGEMKSLLPLIYAGQLLHVGKGAVMGMGKYVVL